MDNQALTVFRYEQKEVRTVAGPDGEPWFVGKDVCEVLGILNTSQAVERLDDDEKDGIYITDSIGREQKTPIVSEAGLYSLILVSRKPEAKAFKRWVTHDVLPSIRKTGAYVAPVQQDPILMQLETIRQMRESQIALEARQQEQAQQIARLERLSVPGERMAIQTYLRWKDYRPLPDTTATGAMGKELTARCAEQAIPLGAKVAVGGYLVNQYPLEMLDTYIPRLYNQWRQRGA